MNKIFEIFRQTKIIPVIAIEDEKNAVPLALALLKGGIKIAEITYRTEAAAKALSELSAHCPDILAGAGTVTTVAQAQEAIACGAKFIVMPGFDKEIVECCQSRGVAVVPGVATPTEITCAIKMGLEVLKLFPAELLGGPEFLDAMAGPFPKTMFIPTGGITAENAASYLEKKNVLAVGGSWLVQKEFINSQKWDIITAEAEKALMMIPRAFTKQA